MQATCIFCILFLLFVMADSCFQIKKVKETSLSANQEKSEMKRVSWEVEGQRQSEGGAIRGGRVDASSLVVELGPMEIRTFILSF